MVEPETQTDSKWKSAFKNVFTDVNDTVEDDRTCPTDNDVEIWIQGPIDQLYFNLSEYFCSSESSKTDDTESPGNHDREK